MESRSSGGRLRTLPAGSGFGADSASLKSGSRAKLEAARVDGGGSPPEPPSPEPPATASQAPHASPTGPAPRVRSLPPLDPTAPRTVRRIPLSRTAVPTPKPILASECLREDAAPVEPFARGSRVTDAALGLAMVGCGVAGWVLLPKATWWAMIVAGAIVAAASAMPRYAPRAAVVLAAATGGWIPTLLDSPSLGVVGRSIAPVLLATALFLRATYRGDRLVRIAIAVGVVAFAGCALGVGGTWLWSPNASLLARLVGGSMFSIALLSLLGFMGEQTTAGCNGWATAVLALSALAPLTERTGLRAPSIVAALGNALGLAIATLASYQLGAVLVAPHARATEISRTSIPAPPPPEDDDEGSLESVED